MKKLFSALCIFALLLVCVTYNPMNKSNEKDVKIESYEQFKVTATMYNAVESQCDADPLITAGMYKINPKKASEHNWVAVSRDLLKRWNGSLDYGDKVLIQGTHKDGIYTVVDTMNKRYTNRIDILETSGTPMYKYKNVKLIKLQS